MLSCIRYRNRLNAYLDGELNARKSKSVAAHVTKCKACRAALEEIRGIAPVLQTLSVPPVPAYLADRVIALARVNATRSREPFMWIPLKWWQTVSAPVRLAACATVLLAFFLGMTMSREISLAGSRRAAASGEAGMEGLEWFSQAPPESLERTYMILASSFDVGGMPR